MNPQKEIIYALADESFPSNYAHYFFTETSFTVVSGGSKYKGTDFRYDPLRRRVRCSAYVWKYDFVFSSDMSYIESGVCVEKNGSAMWSYDRNKNLSNNDIYYVRRDSTMGSFTNVPRQESGAPRYSEDDSNLRSNPFSERCLSIRKQVELIPQVKDVMQQLQTMQAQLEAAETAMIDYKLIASLGKALKAIQLQAQQLPLSEEDYRTLADRHATLVQEIDAKCRELTKAKCYDELDVLASELAELQALDLGGQEPAWINDPVMPPPDAVPVMAGFAATVSASNTTEKDDQKVECKQN